MTGANDDRDDHPAPMDGFGAVRHGPWFPRGHDEQDPASEGSDGLASELLRDFRVIPTRDSIPGWVFFRLVPVDHGGCT
jgi:hypothetical protein